MERYDLSVHRGETFVQPLIFRGSEGLVLDLTGYEAYSQVRPEPESEELICSMVCTIEALTGTVTMTIGANVTKTIPAGCYAYDLMMKDPDDVIRTYIGGRFAVLPSVTELS